MTAATLGIDWERPAAAWGRWTPHGAVVLRRGCCARVGLRPEGGAWVIAVERPETGRRAAQSILALQDAAVATSGDHRHWVEVGRRPLSHGPGTRGTAHGICRLCHGRRCDLRGR